MQYTANLMELWNQIEAVQDRMSMLNSYESLERDLFGDVLSFDKPMGYGASNQDNLDYAMEQIKLHDIDHNIEDIDLSKEYPIDNQDAVYFNEHSVIRKQHLVVMTSIMMTLMTKRTILMMKAY